MFKIKPFIGQQLRVHTERLGERFPAVDLTLTRASFRIRCRIQAPCIISACVTCADQVKQSTHSLYHVVVKRASLISFYSPSLLGVEGGGWRLSGEVYILPSLLSPGNWPKSFPGFSSLPDKIGFWLYTWWPGSMQELHFSIC